MNKNPFGLNRAEKLKSRTLIKRLFSEGKNIYHFPLRCMYFIVPKIETPVQVGFTASARVFKRAVQRNRLKRLQRESYRLQKSDLVDHVGKTEVTLLVFFQYVGKEMSDYKTIYQGMSEILSALQNAVNVPEAPAKERDPEKVSHPE